MVALGCPLCCNETFASPSSLKCHILNILERLVCPWCRGKFHKLSELADHLEDKCPEHGAALKQEVEVDRSTSILAKALMGEKAEVEVEEAQYYCQMCSMYLEDVDQHLREHHEGQEIVLEEEENVDTEEKDGGDDNETIFIVDSAINEAEDQEVEEEEEEDTVADGDEAEAASLANLSRRKFNTITEHEVKDKEGRPYTRKFVKIDKFWLDKSNLKEENQVIEVSRCPVCHLYYTSTEQFYGHRCVKAEVGKEGGGGTISTLDSTQEPLTVVSTPQILKEVEIGEGGGGGEEEKKHMTGPFNCEVCNTTFPTFKSLRLHRRMHEPIKSREIEAPSRFGLLEGDVNEDRVRHMFICKICNKTYDKQYEAVHMNSHNANNGYNCEVCNRKFYTQANLEMHMKAHSNNKKFTCSYCKKPFVTYDALNEHLVNQCQKRPYACQFCGRRFARPHEKVKHERIHTGEKPHVCEICGKAFRVSYCLTLHLRTHSGTRPYQCKHCGKRFKSHSVYNHHTLTHSDVRAYKCPYCPKAFKTSVQLAGHKNSHIKPFTCTECNRPFASLYAVRAHMETHKRDNNLKYECWICGALYSRAFALRDHLKQQHQQQEGEVEEGRGKAVAVPMDEEMEAANSILVTEDDIILGLDGASNIEIIEHEAE